MIIKKVIIFGATGNTGCYLVDYCLENLDQNEYEIIAVGKRKTDFFSKKGITYYSVDISKTEDFEVLPTSDVHAVLFLAGILPATMEGYRPMDYITINTVGALNILEYCRLAKADRILYTQTFYDIGLFQKDNILLKPEMPRKFSFTGDHAVYAISKNAAVDLIEHYHQEYGIKRFIFRLPTVYGYYNHDYYYVDGVKTILGYRKLINRAIAGEPIEVYGDPKRVKDMVYVKDCCQMMCKAITAYRNSGFYNVGTGVGVSLLDQIKGIIDVFSPSDHPSEIILSPEKPDSPQYIMDISNARTELGYDPKYNYIDYLKDFKLEMELKQYAELN